MNDKSATERESVERSTSGDENRKETTHFGWSLLRLIAWSLAGTAAALCLIPASTFLGRYRAIALLFRYLTLPADAMFSAWAVAGFGPHGDTGFVMIIVFLAVEGTAAGFLLGLFLAWRRRSRRLGQGTGRPRIGRMFAYAAILIMLAAAGYCLEQEWLIAKDRRYFLEQVDYRAFAEASLDLLADPDNYGLTLGDNDIHDPRIPETIRGIAASSLAYNGYSLSVCNFYFQNLTFCHNFNEQNRYDVRFEAGSDGPVVLYSTMSDRRPKIDY